VSCTPGAPLDTRAIEVAAARAGATFDLSTWTGAGEAFAVEAMNASVRLEARQKR
jgi:hypothetical protein